MSNRRFIIFFLTGIIFLAALLAFLSWHARAVASASTRNTLCTLDPQSLNGIEVSRYGTNMVKLVRGESGTWKIVSPYAAPTDSASVARLIDMMTLQPFGDLRTESELAELGEDFVDFGLSGNVRAVVTLHTDVASVRVSFGSRSASGKDIYARTEGLRNVFTLPEAVLDAIPGTADGFRSRTIIAAAADQISGLDLRSPESPFVRLVRNASGWRLSSPVDAPADDAVVESLVNELASVRVMSFVLPSANHAASMPEQSVLSQSVLMPYGLTAESGLSVTVKSASGAPEQIVFGSSAGTNTVHALIRNGTAVVTLPSAVADLFRKGDAAFRDTRIFPFDADERVKSVSFSQGDVVYVLSRGTNDVWRLEAPVAAPADSAVASALVDSILRIRRNDVPDIIPESASVRISVETSNGVYPDVTVDQTLFRECGPLSNLRSKTLLKVDSKTVRRISLKPAAGVARTVVFDPERGVWNMQAGTAAPAKVRLAAVKALLLTLTRVEAEDVETVSASPADLERCGLDKPSLVVALDFDGANAVRRNLLLGGPAPGGGRYATVGGADAVFVLARATVANLMISITE